MNYKVFKFSKAKVMVMETKKFVEYYMQINSSNWHFCVGCQENFDDVTEDMAESIMKEYFDYVDNDERLLNEVAEAKMKYLMANIKND